MHKRVIAASLIAFIAASFAIDRPARAEDAFKVGVIVPLSGPNAEFGNNIRNGMQLAADHINAQGGIVALGGAKVELVFADVPTPAKASPRLRSFTKTPLMEPHKPRACARRQNRRTST